MKKCTMFLSGVGVLAFSLMSYADPIDLKGESRLLASDEYAASFVNTSEMLAELTVDTSEAVVFTGEIAGNVRLVKKGAGKITISSSSSYEGGTYIQAGTVGFAVAGALGTGMVTVSAEGTLSLDAPVACENAIHLMSSKSYLLFNVKEAGATFSGPITGENGISFAPQIFQKGTNYRFDGSITIPDGTLSTPGQDRQSSYISFYGKVSVKTVKQSSSSNRAALRFFAAGNEWEQFILNQASGTYSPYFAAHAIPVGSSVYMDGAGKNILDVGGDQDIGCLSAKSDKSATLNAKAASCVRIGSEVEYTGAAQRTSGYVFTGPLSLVYAAKNADSVWTVSRGSSTMTGSITVENGVFSIADTATFQNIVSLAVSNAAVFSCTSTKETPLKSLASICLAREGALVLGEGIELSPQVFLIDNAPPSGTGWFTGIDNPSPQAGDRQTLPQLKGTGRLFIPFQGARTEAVWDGGAGSGNPSVLTAENWVGDNVPDFSEGGLVVTFATAGSSAVLPTVAVLDEVRFLSPISFLLASSSDSAVLKLANGISASLPTGVESVTNTLTVPIVMTKEQGWTLVPRTVLALRAPLGAETNTSLYWGGGGTFEVYSTNTYTGDLIVTGGTVCVYSATNAFGRAGGEVDFRQRNGAVLDIRESTVIEKDFHFNNAANQNGVVTMPSGTTCTFAGNFRANANWRPDFGNRGTVIFAGGGSFDSYFTPSSGTLVFSGSPFSFGTGFNVTCPKVVFRIGENTFGGDVWVNGEKTLALEAENALGASTSVTLHYAGTGRSYMICSGGYSQRCGNLNMKTSTSIVEAEEPMTLTVNQKSNITWLGDFSGPLTLVKGGSGTATINKAMSSTGDIRVIEGELAFGASGSWTGAKIVVVENAVLSLTTADSFSKDVVLHTAGAAKIAIGEGVRVKVLEWRHEGKSMGARDYTADNSGGLVSGGVLTVGSPALRVIVR